MKAPTTSPMCVPFSQSVYPSPVGLEDTPAHSGRWLHDAHRMDLGLRRRGPSGMICIGHQYFLDDLKRIPERSRSPLLST